MFCFVSLFSLLYLLISFESININFSSFITPFFTRLSKYSISTLLKFFFTISLVNTINLSQYSFLCNCCSPLKFSLNINCADIVSNNAIVSASPIGFDDDELLPITINKYYYIYLLT